MRKMQITVIATLFTQVQKITIYSLWEQWEKPHVFQLRQLHQSQRRVEMCVPTGICWRTVRCFAQQIFVEQIFQKLLQKGPQ